MDQTADMGLEPQARARSNTWPLPRPENFIEPDAVDMSEAKCGVNLPGGSHVKKNSSRRNAWGNLSYADLITQAIGSAPEKRLTLSQIYEWMVQNVTYFKDKGDSNSSAGWKNSIRHNLSLHNRFMRVQNEGTGKSSWWMINPDAKPGKSARRRATSMETSKFEKRRGRVKRKVEALRSGLDPPTPSPSSSVSESLDLFPESPLHSGFQLSPDFRPRASSNASTTSCSGGRLSPIPAVSEGADWPPGPPPGYYGPEQLAGSLEQNMRLGQGAAGGGASPFGGPPPPPYRPSASSVPPSYLPSSCSLHRQVHPCPNCALPHKQRSLGYGEGVESAATMMGQLMGALNPTMLDDLNLNIETVPLHDFDCNVDEVIKHELSLDGTLDFNFSGQQQPSSAPGSGHGGFSGDSWVH